MRSFLALTVLFASQPGCSCQSKEGTGETDAGPEETDAGSNPLCIDPESPFQLPAGRDRTVTPNETWAGNIGPDSPLLTSHSQDEFSDPIKWGKWTVLLEDPGTVYFQDTNTYKLHHEFVSQDLDPYNGIDPEDLDAISLYNDRRTVALGAVLFPTRPGIYEYGIQIVSVDPLHPQLVVDLFQRVASTVSDPTRFPVYVPAPGQEACAEQSSDWFAEHGIRIASVDDWLPGDQCYSSAWGVGRLVTFPVEELESAALAGELLPGDILLLDEPAPAELPPVSGLLTLEPSTPNSHTAILAQSFGIPFAYLRTQESADRAQSLVGSIVGLGSSVGYGSCEVSLYDLSEVDSALIDDLLEMVLPPPLEVPAIELRGALTADVDDLGPTDLAWVGGKAAHYGVLRDQIPESVRPAAAITMDLWSEFLDQEIGDQSLRAHIDQRLGGFTWPPPMAEVDTALTEVRALIEDQTIFTQAQHTAVESALANFAADERLRFRSSANVEDGLTFTGAGLYDSISGCLADDTDGDEDGPSACNPDKAEERGVFRAIRRVYSSFYDRNAYLQRLRRQVDESDVGMAILVHHSFPDETEEANGVVVMSRYGSSDSLEIVSQPGAESVTNPDGTFVPEVVDVEAYTFGEFAYLRQGSALLPLGATVLAFESEYLALTDLLTTVADAFEPDENDALRLDFEYKKITDEGLVVKQVRPLPFADTTRDVEPLLVDRPATLCVAQVEYGDVFANHRLKTKLGLRSKTQWMTEAAMMSTPLTDIDYSYLDQGQLEGVQGDPETLDGYGYQLTESTMSSSFDVAGTPARRISIGVPRPLLFTRNTLPITELSRLPSTALSATYDEPVEFTGWDGPGSRTEETALLSSHCPDDYDPQASDVYQTRTIVSAGITVQTGFYWPAPPTGPTAGYTAPLLKFNQTTISGLTIAPLILTSQWAQTSRPEHHNFGASYIFEPAVDPAVSSGQRAELQAADVMLIYATEDNEIMLMGFDGTLRSP